MEDQNTFTKMEIIVDRDDQNEGNDGSSNADSDSYSSAIAGEDSPFTEQDIINLNEEAKWFKEENGWSHFKSTELAEVWRRTTDSIQRIKGRLFFPGIPCNAVLELIVNLKLRIQWEKQFVSLEVLEEHNGYRVIYWRVKTPMGTSDRDFVMNLTHGPNQDGGYYVLYKNTTHPSKPEIPGVVRAENMFSGALIYPDKDNPDSTRVIILAQDNLKGIIPKAIVSMFYSRAPFDWRDNLDNFYHTRYKRHELINNVL